MKKKFSLLTLVLFFGCQSNEKDLIDTAIAKLENSNTFKYHQTITGFGGLEGDFVGTADFRKNPESRIGWDFVGRNNIGDVAFIDNDLKMFDHNNKIVYTYPKEYIDETLNSNIVLQHSPLDFLNKKDWEFIQDTTINGQTLREFKRNELDTTIVEEESREIADNHIFINTRTGLLERFERPYYRNGRKSSVSTVIFEDYELNSLKENFSFVFTDGYKSFLFGEDWSSLSIGQIAPTFQSKEIDGKVFNLDDFRGSKVLLNFSFINCGGCKLALRHFNSPDYNISKKIKAFYIDPVDKKEDVELYEKKQLVPYPILEAPVNIQQLYKINGYPTFVLIDEEGKIENIRTGYSSDFLNSLETE